MRASLKRAGDAIRGASRIVIASHVNPDGDTLGSSLALAHGLRAMGKSVLPLSHDGVPEILRWMPGQEWVRRETEERGFDLAIVCDTGTLDRVGSRVRPAIEAISPNSAPAYPSRTKTSSAARSNNSRVSFVFT